MVSIKDVAKAAEVSIATVSRVLANKEYVKESTRKKVLTAVQELGYKPSRVARSLRVRSSQIIGLIISDIQNPFFTSLVRAVEDFAYENNYAVFLCNTDEDKEKEALYIDLMLAERVAGVIITPTREEGCPIKKLLDAKIPTVSVDRRVRDCNVSTVVLDNVGGAYQLIDHLIQNGHRRIGSILGSPEITTGRERLEGYQKALRDHGIPYDPQLVRQGLPKENYGFRYANELLDLKEIPTALFAGNNLLAIGTIQAIKDRGLSIPQDISLVSFDDQEWTKLVEPKITVVAQPTYQLGRKAAELVMRSIQKYGLPARLVLLEPTLQLRDSVAKLAHAKEVSS